MVSARRPPPPPHPLTLPFLSEMHGMPASRHRTARTTWLADSSWGRREPVLVMVSDCCVRGWVGKPVVWAWLRQWLGQWCMQAELTLHSHPISLSTGETRSLTACCSRSSLRVSGSSVEMPCGGQGEGGMCVRVGGWWVVSQSVSLPL